VNCRSDGLRACESQLPAAKLLNGRKIEREPFGSRELRAGVWKSALMIFICSTCPKIRQQKQRAINTLIRRRDFTDELT
jgi:hypothetical protein